MKSYPEYKEAEIEWVGKLPSHWKVMPLKYAALVNREALTEQVEEDFELQYIDIGNVNQLGLVNPPERMKFIDAPSRARRIIKKNDTIISTVRTYLKAVAFIDRDDDNLIASTGFATLTSLNETHPKYLYYLVSNQGFVDTVSAYSTGVSYPAITATELARITAWLPPLPEQQAISEFLDCKTAQIDTLIEKKQRQIDLLQEQRTAFINHAVTKGLNPDVPMKDLGVEWLREIPSHWIISKFRWACSSVRDGTHTPPPRVEGIHRLLSARNIVDGEFITRDDDRTMSPEDFEILQKSYTVEKGDIVIAIVGATTGKSAIVGEMENVSVQRSLAILRPSNKFRSAFLNYWIYTPLIQNSIQRTMTQYAAQPGIYLEDLSDLRILMPPLSEQDDITAWLNNKTKEIDTSKSRIELQIEYLSEYRTALISEAVTGKIDVRTETIHE